MESTEWALSFAVGISVGVRACFWIVVPFVPPVVRIAANLAAPNSARKRSKPA